MCRANTGAHPPTRTHTHTHIHTHTHTHARALQCKDGTYQRRLLPELLRKTHLDLSTAFEFCAAYHVPRNVAVQLYIEMLLLARSASDSTDYQVSVAFACGVLIRTLHARKVRPPQP